LAAVTLFLVAAAMAAITIIVLGAAKIMLAILLAVSPVVIACTMFKQTAPIFEAWVKLALGFAFVPLLVATMAGFTIAAGTAVAPRDLATVETISDAISFVVVMILGAGLMALVPGFANSIAATNIGIGAIASRSAGYPGAAMRTGGAMTRGADSFVRGASAGAAGFGVSERSSSAAKVGSYSARSVKAAIALASKMKRG
jgi:type IV secretion system protein VirB6